MRCLFVSFYFSKNVPSVETFDGCVKLIGETQPDYFILENVPAIDATTDESCLAFSRQNKQHLYIKPYHIIFTL